MNSKSEDPLTPLMDGIAQIHEFFMSLMRGGFTEYQALTIVGTMLAASQGRSGGESS